MRAAWCVSLVLAGCHARTPRLEITDGPGHWRAAGFVEMVSPIRLPTSVDSRENIQVWLALPATPLAVVEAGGSATLRYPPGTAADRVELVGGKVADVRGTTFGADGDERFHVYRATRAGALVGYQWRRANERESREAQASLDELLRSEGESESMRAEFRHFNECANCHQAGQPPHTNPGAASPHRGTDASGLFAVATVLTDRAPVETHRPRDANADDPFVSVWCGAVRATLQSEPNGARRFVCSDGAVAEARLDLRGALAVGDAHAEAVCRSRAYLFEHLDATGRATFASSFQPCERFLSR